MVKANGYGHGDVEISKQLEKDGVKHLGVGLIEEGLLLREMGVQTGLLFFGVCDERGAKVAVENRMTPVMSTWDQIRAFEACAPAGYPVHLKFDTGMHRLGFSMKDVIKLSQYFANQSKMKVEGVLTHLHTGEDAFNTEGSSFAQLKLFQIVEKAFQAQNVMSHTLNSAGLIGFLSHQGKVLPHGISPIQGVRPGLAIYGVSPVKDSPLFLKPVMSLRSKTVKYHFVPAGEGVSYNHTWTAPTDSVIAIIPIGYADGYHRLLSNKAEVLFRGQRVPLVGNVCMDYLMADVTSTLKNETVDSLKPEPVTLFGQDEKGNEISVGELAQKAQTISWEILTSVGERVPREVETQTMGTQT
jgi:alanine racemase